MRTKKKSGFNLIEIAIVLAVIGLVIGGIYVAASAVTENNRRQTTQKQILQVVQNVRTMYASQAIFTAPTYAQIKAMNLFPADLTDNGSGFLNAYGGPFVLYASPTPQYFVIAVSGLPSGACIDFLAKGFGAPQANVQMGLNNVGNLASYLGVAATSDGVSLTEATGLCSLSGSTNMVQLEFLVRN